MSREINALIITIGDEILIGQILDSNKKWMAQQLTSIGVTVRHMLTISDSKKAILDALQNSINQYDIILMTGGLGPTKDDITKKTIAEFFNTPLVENKHVLEDVKIFFEHREKKMKPVHFEQALVPQNATVIRNTTGTAPGMLLKSEKSILFSMPGVPFEMKKMVGLSILSHIQSNYDLPAIVHQTLNTVGIGESSIAEILTEFENNLPVSTSLAYLPSPGGVRLRLTTIGESNKEALQLNQALGEKVQQLLGDFVFSTQDQTIAAFISEILKEKNLTISTAESCTGGNIANELTNFEGSSQYFIGSVISYANQIKIAELGVQESILNTFGAVSEEVVTQMALGIREKYKTDYAIATSGIAGPGGGTPDKPVGTIWISVANKEGVIAEKLTLGDDRLINIARTTTASFDLLRKRIFQL